MIAGDAPVSRLQCSVIRRLQTQGRKAHKLVGALSCVRNVNENYSILVYHKTYRDTSARRVPALSHLLHNPLFDSWSDKSLFMNGTLPHTSNSIRLMGSSINDVTIDLVFVPLCRVNFFFRFGKHPKFFSSGQIFFTAHVFTRLSSPDAV